MGIFIFTGSYQYPVESNVTGAEGIEGEIEYKLAIYIRDNKYKLVFENFYHNGVENDYGFLYEGELIEMPFSSIPERYHQTFWKRIRFHATTKTDQMIAYFQRSMSEKSELEKEW